MIKKKYPANWNAKLESWKPPTSWTRASHFVDRWHFWQKCQIRFFPHPLNGWHDRTYHWTFVGECGMGDFTDLVCTYWKDFFPTYNGVSLFFSIVRHERYFFQSRIFFSQESISMLFFLSKSVCRTFFLKSPITPSKSNGQPLKSTKHLVSWQILICQSFLKAFETIGDKTLKGRREEFVSTCHYLESPYGRMYGWTYGDVITKFSRIDSFPNFITHGAPLRALRARRLR